MKIKDTVSVSELRKKFSFYLRKVKRGSSIRVTVRGRLIAVLAPTIAHSDMQIARKLSRKSIGSWTGGKPGGASRRIAVNGKPVSEIVIEERR